VTLTVTTGDNGGDSTGTDTPPSSPLQPCQKTSPHRNIPAAFTTNNHHTLQLPSRPCSRPPRLTHQPPHPLHNTIPPRHLHTEHRLTIASLYPTVRQNFPLEVCHRCWNAHDTLRATLSPYLWAARSLSTGMWNTARPSATRRMMTSSSDKQWTSTPSPASYKTAPSLDRLHRRSLNSVIRCTTETTK
jgi:hypothetical protein